MMRLKASLIVATAALISAGCHHEQLPTYARLDDRAMLNVLAERGRRIHTVGGTGSLSLTQANGSSVRLSLVMALQPPDDARLQTAKFNQSVFDLTITPAGAWLAASHHSSHAADIHSAGINATQVARAWALLGGGFFAEPDLQTKDAGNRLLVTRRRPGEPVVVCEVDRDTQTPRVYRLYDDVGNIRFTLQLGDYQNIDGILWPRKVIATSDTGVIEVDLDDVELNVGLPETAFVPPRRAEKLP